MNKKEKYTIFLRNSIDKLENITFLIKFIYNILCITKKDIIFFNKVLK